MKHTELETLSDRLIALLRTSTLQIYSWEKIQKKLGCDRKQLDQALALAADCDYRFRVRQRTGVAFVSAPDSLTRIEIQHKLKTKLFARELVAYRSINSTNDLAARLAETGAVEGTLVVAEQQAKGRGRLGRTWHSPPGSGIYMSIVLRPKFKPEEAPGMSIMTALALADTIEPLIPGEVRIKWPNDLLIGRRKTAGILTELSAESRKINYVIIGVGINVNQGVGSFPGELANIATSLRRASKKKQNRIAVLQSFLVNLERHYDLYGRHRLRKSMSKIRRYSTLLGREVTIKSGRETYTGRAVDFDPDGSLIIETKSGKQQIRAGEVTVVSSRQI